MPPARATPRPARELARAAAGYGGRIIWARAGDDARLVPLLEEGLAALGERTSSFGQAARAARGGAPRRALAARRDH